MGDIIILLNRILNYETIQLPLCKFPSPTFFLHLLSCLSYQLEQAIYILKNLALHCILFKKKKELGKIVS